MGLNPELEHAIDRIAKTPILLVASDFDGTLAPIVPNPSDARGTPEALSALNALAAMDSTHGSIISGRARADLITLLGAHVGTLHLIGSHGAEMNGDPSLTPEQASAVELLQDGAARLAARFPGLLIEHKPSGIAIHYRHVEAEAHNEVRERIEALGACVPGAMLRPGLMVLEILVTRADKGTALAHVRRRVGATGAIFLGDDTTDEDAFSALDHSDLAIKVGDGPTRAWQRVASQEDVPLALSLLSERRAEWLATRRLVPINHHALLSDQRTIAIVEPAGRISWLCVPRLDSTAIFASMLGDERAGYFDILPEHPTDAPTQAYLGDTLTLRTHHGTIEIIDYLDCTAGRPYQRAGRTDLIRVVSGSGRAHIRFAPRLDFGRIPTNLRIREGGVELVGSVDPIVLRAPGVEWELVQEGPHQTAIATINLTSGPCMLELRAGTSTLRESTVPEQERREQTAETWEKWAAKLRLPALYPDLVKRSALTIRSLCYGPSGAISAAATTSLPEQLGGVRNWDYRYCWIRDASWSAASLVQLGLSGHAMKLLDWILGIVDNLDGPERLRPLYTVSGHDLGPEAEIPELAGYAESRPVRVGNAANQQVQLDVFGTVADLIAQLAEAGAPLTPEHMRLLDAMVEAVARRWHEPDHGIWEVRGPPRHHVPSKIMCWHTIDRAIVTRQIIDGTIREDDAALRSKIHLDILAHGFSAKLGGLSGSYDCDEPDAACLLGVLTGLLPPDDPRMIGTVEAVERHLRRGVAVYRYLGDDGLPGIEGGFNICTGWLIESYAAIGRDQDALELLRQFVALAGPTGLFAEEHDPIADRPLGNFPQCYSHLAMINAALRLSRLNVLSPEILAR